MAVVIETTLGDITVDLYLDQRPVTCLNFLKLCKMKYYNYNLFHSIRSGFIAQTGDPTGEGSGGQSIFGLLEGPEKRFFSGEKMPKIRHTDTGLLSMVGTGDMMIGSQFFFTLGPDLDSLDGVHCVIGIVTEGHEILRKLNEVICDDSHRPYRDVRITHTVVLEDPFNDPVGLRPPSRSPSPSAERLKGGRIAPDEEIDETQGKSAAEIQEIIEEKEAKARATILEIVGDLPDADIAPPENVLFVCKLNPVTTDDDLEIIFSRFGKIVSCEVIRDKKTGDSLQYAFIEFADKKSCEDAYFKMDNVLIDDRRIHVDFSQSVSKMKWLGKGRGVKYFNEDGDRSDSVSSSRAKKSGSRERKSNDYSYDRNFNSNSKKYDRQRENYSEKSFRKRSRSPVDMKSTRNYTRNENNSSRNENSHNIIVKGSKSENFFDKNNSKRYENDNISKNPNVHSSRSSPSRGRREENSRHQTEHRQERRKREKDEPHVSREKNAHRSRDIIRPNKDHGQKESRRMDRNERKTDEQSDILLKRSEKTIDRDEINENRRSRESNDLSRDKKSKISSSCRGYNNDLHKDNHNDKRVNKSKVEIEQDHKSEQMDYEYSQDRVHYKSHDAKIQNKDRNETRDHRHKNDDRKFKKENSENNKRKHNDRESESQTRKRSKVDSENVQASTPSPKGKISKKSKNKREQRSKNKKVLKKKRKLSTSSDSSSDSSSSSESSTSSDGSRKKKSQRRKRKKYCTSSSSSSSSSASSTSSSSSSTESSSSSCSSSDRDARNAKKKRTKKNITTKKK